MRLHRASALGLVILLALSACVPNVQPTSPAETAAAQSAADQANQGRFDQAAQAYTTLAAQAPPGRADHYRLLAAEAYRQENALDNAGPVLSLIDRTQLTGDEPLRLDLLRAELALRQHDAFTALKLTTQPEVSIPDNLRPRLLELRAQALAGTGDLWGAARSRVEMDNQLQGIDRAQNRDQAIQLMMKLGADPLKQRAAGMKPGDAALPWINEALTRLGVAVAQSQPNLNEPVGTLVAGSDANVREGFKMPKQVALLLPNTDTLSAASQAVREGFFAGYFQSGQNHAPRAAIRVYDSGGTAASALKAYAQAVSDGAQLIIGPLARPEVTAVLAQSTLPVPVLTLNQIDGQTTPATNATQFALLPQSEGSQAADHMLDRGIRNVYVITSTDDFAKRAAAAFKAELTAHGGTIIGNGQISTGTVNYADTINGLSFDKSDVNAVAGASSAAPASASTSGAPDASASGNDKGIFISMRPEQARLLLPQLRVARVTLPVFGTSHIYAGVDDATANRDLEGVEFSDAPWLFDAQSGLAKHDDIAAQLPAARGQSARLFAFGMDAWNLVPYLDWLRGHPGSYLPGASGQLAADTFGHINRVLIWAKFQDGLARPVSGDLQSDSAPASSSSAPLPAANAPTAPAPASSAPMPGNPPVNQ